MTTSSMTGFARASGQANGRAWAWELRSVNGRGLEVRCRLAPGFEATEIGARQRIAKRFKRGSITANLTVNRSSGPPAMRINADLLDRLIALVPEIQTRLGAAGQPPSAEALLAIRGVVEPAEDDLSEADQAALEAQVLEDLDRALGDLQAMRDAEGSRLGEIVSGHVQRIADLAVSAAQLAATQPEALRTRLREQIAALLENGASVSEERLAQEAALLATKADPREEIDRLNTHVDAARKLIAGNGPVGRRLDFLCQELNREANTLCSKSPDAALTAVGIDLKAAIDQFREQVQNLE